MVCRRLILGSLLCFAVTGCFSKFKAQKSALGSSTTLASNGVQLTTLAILQPSSLLPSQGRIHLVGSCAASLGSVNVTGDVAATVTIPCTADTFAGDIALSAGDGPKNLQVRQSISMGSSVAVDSRTFVLDTSAPAVGVLNIANGAWVGKSLTVSGGCESGLQVAVSVSNVTQMVNCTAGLYSANLSLAGLPDGDLTFQAAQTDAAANSGLIQIKLHKDTVAPAVTISAPVDGAAVTSPATVSGSCEAGLPVAISGAGVAAPVMVNCTAGAFSTTITLTAGTGSKVVTATQTDLAQNVGSVSKTFQYTVPANNIAVMITQPAAGQAAQSGVTLQGTCKSGLNVAIAGTGVAAASSVACTNGAFSAPISYSSGDGAKIVTVSQMDGLGSTGSDARSFIRDTTAPVVTIGMPVANSSFKNAAQIAGSCESGLNVTLGGAVAASVSVPCANSVYTGTVTLSSGDGNKVIQVTQTDAAGNVGQTSRTLVLDTTAPLVKILSPAANTSDPTGVTVSGSCESGLIVTAQGTDIQSAVSQACTAAAFSLAVVFTAVDGNKTVTVSQTDAAGNTGSDQRVFVRATPQVPVDGVAVYNQICAACHGPLATSAKLGRTAADITNALATVPAMSSISLSASQIQAVATALAINTSATQLKFQCTDATTRGLGETAMTRLTTPELMNTLTDLLGADIVADSTIQVQFQTLPADIMKLGVSDIVPSTPDIEAQAMLNIASRVADMLTASATYRTRILGSCSSATTVTNACAQAFIDAFGLKTYRRPLSATESASLLSQFQTTGGTVGMIAVMMRLLMSPAMVFHLELGASVQGARVRLTDYEVASRLSYRIAGTMPDATLFQAAANGLLQDVTNLRTQARRLVTTSATAKARVGDFFRFYTKSDQVIPPYAPAGALNGIDVTGLDVEMAQETTDYVNHVVWDRNGKFKDLLVSTDVYPRSSRMAKILESTVATGTAPAQTSSAHAGLLLRPALMSDSFNLSKPYHRAAVIRKGYLCETLGVPDPSLVAAQIATVGDTSALSNRDRLTVSTNTPVCLSCHGLLNPVGFVLEGYDQLGMRRTVETDYDANGKVVGTHPIVTGVGRTYLYDASGSEVQSLSDALGLVQVISTGGAARSCFAQRVFEYQRARPYVPADFCALSEVESASTDSGTILDAYINGVANEDIFWKAGGN